MDIRWKAAGLALFVAACGGGATSTSAVAPTPAGSAATQAPAPPVHFPADWSFAQGAPSPHSAQGMVATDAALATKVGVAVLDSGGNAVDAAVATAFALAVVFPTAGNVGGGGFLVARIGGKPHALDFRDTAPRASARHMS